MRNGLLSVVATCALAIPLAAQSVTAPAPRTILPEAMDVPPSPSPASKPPSPKIAPAKADSAKSIRLVSQTESVPTPLAPAYVLQPPPKEPREWKDMPAPSAIVAQPAIVDLPLHDGANEFHCWGRAEYLLWHVSNAPLPKALVTAGDPLDTLPGALGQAGTRTLLGESASLGSISGMRFTVGGWLNHDRNIGIEASAFVLQYRSTNFAASSDVNGNPLIALPFFNQSPGQQGESAVQVSNSTPPGQPLTGGVLVSSTSQLWGGELNTVFCLWSRPGCEFCLLTGFRYADLRETLGISNSSTDFLTTPATATTFNDHFNTRNQFYGGQLGARFSWQYHCLSLDTTLKVALGVNHELVDIHGDMTEAGGATLTVPYGLFTEPSNVGQRSSNQFTVLPSAEVRFGYQITKWCSLFVGYDGLFWNQVVRPGNQLDRNINLTQNANGSFFTGGGTLVGPASPAPNFNRSDFWAQGVSFGFEFHY